MTIDRYDDLTPQQRAALVTAWILKHGSVETTEIADRLSITWHGAYYILLGLSLVLPIYYDDGYWRLMEPP